MIDRPSPTAALTAFFIGLITMFTCATLAIFLNLYKTSTSAYAASIVFEAVAFGLPTILYYRRNPQLKQTMRLNPISPTMVLLVIVTALIGVISLLWINIIWSATIQAIGLVPSPNGTPIPHTPFEFWFGIAGVAIAPALFEELLFRGLLLSALETIGRKLAIFVSGMLFAMLHAQIEAFPAHVFIGMILAQMVLDTGSLYTAILFHGIYNGSILFLVYVSAMIRPIAEESTSIEINLFSTFLIGILLAIIWFFLLSKLLRRGAREQSSPLPTALRSPLTKPAKVMLIFAFVVLIFMEYRALRSMLPGGLL